MRLALVRPISFMEEAMIAKYRIREVEFIEFSKPHGFVKVRDLTVGAVWHCHPEAFDALDPPEEAAATLVTCHQRDKHRPGKFCSNCQGWG